jgi:phosphoglycolate phosphatase
MDGTLIDSGNVITNTINFVRSNIGLDILQKDELLSNLNNPDINSARFFYGTNEFTPEQTELFTHYYDKHCVSDIVLYDGVLEMLDELSLHFTLTIATNASKDFAAKMVKHLSIDNYFNLIVGSTCVENPKPHPDMLLKTMKSLKLGTDDAVLVGDSKKDEKAALALDMDHYLVNWGFSNHTDQKAVHTIEELTDILLKFK